MTDTSLRAKTTDRPRKPIHKKRWPWYTAAGIAAFLVLLPVGIKFGAQYALTELGAESARIDDVDLNLFTGEVGISGLQVHYQQKPTLTLESLRVNLAMLALFKQRILVQDFQLSGLNLSVYQDQDNWVVGIPLPQASEEEVVVEELDAEPSAWTFGINNIGIHLLAVDALYQQQLHTVRIDELLALELLMWTPEHRSQFRFNGSINDAAINIDSGLQPFAEVQRFTLKLQLQELNLAALSGFLPEDIDSLKARLSIDTELQATLHPTGDIALEQKGYVALALDELAMQDMLISADDIRWDGHIGVNMVKDTDPSVTAEGTVSLTKLDAQSLPLLVSARLDDVRFVGNAALDVAKIDESLTVNGKVTLDEFALYDQQEEGNLLSFSQLALNDIAVKGLNDITLSAIDLNTLKTLQSKNSHIAGFNRLSLNGLSLAQMNKAHLKEIVLDGLNVAVSMNAQGQLVVIDDWLKSIEQRQQTLATQTAASDANETSSEQSRETAASEDSEKPAEPFHYRVDAIRFAGDNRIRFTDGMVKPAVVHPVEIKTLKIGTINSENTAAKTPLDVQLKLYKFGSFTVKGDITPLAATEQLSGDITAQIAGIELADLSYYLENSMGYQANSGQLNVASKAKLNQGKLDSDTKVTIQRIDLKPANEEIIEKINQHLTMPISTVLMIITDSNNTLNLTVPVKGDLANPDVKIGRIASGALLQAVKNTAMTYFKYAVQPFGAILMVSETIGDMHLQARFEDIRFVAGQAQLVPEQAGYLEKIAGMIKEKKNFSIVACVMITDQDFAARATPPALEAGSKLSWDAESEALADARSSLIRAALIEQYEVPVNQIQSCKPLLSTGLPRAALGI